MEVFPVKDLKKIESIKKILRSDNTRNFLLFTFGVNSGLRISDLLSLNIGDVFREGKILDSIELLERKTGKKKCFPLNKSIVEATREYLKIRGNADSSEPLFLSRKNKGRLTRGQARRILCEVGVSVGLEKLGTHSLRKTFGYHVYKKTGNLALVQKLLNHSSSAVTMRYIGLTKDEMDEAYISLNL